MSKCLIVTGGGRGIGAEVSRKAAKQGYSVCVNFHRDQTSAQKLVRELEKEGANALAYQADVSQEEEVEALFETVEKDLGTPEALVNNAGILDLQTRVDGMDAERNPGQCRPARIHRHRNPSVRGRTGSHGTGPPAGSDEKGGAGRRGCGCNHVAAF